MQGITVKNNFGAEKSTQEKMRPLLNSFKFSPPASISHLSLHLKPSKARAYARLDTFVHIQQGEILTGSDLPATRSKPDGVEKRRGSLLRRKSREFYIEDKEQVGFISGGQPSGGAVGNRADEQPKLLLGGFYKVEARKFKGFSSVNIKNLGSPDISLKDKRYQLQEVSPDNKLALLFNDGAHLMFFSEYPCISKMISVDECHVMPKDGGRESSSLSQAGYVVFRIRRNCVAAFDSLNDESARDKLFLNEPGVYIFPRQKISNLVVYDFNDAHYYGPDQLLKAVHVTSDHSSIYYKKSMLKNQEEKVLGRDQVKKSSPRRHDMMLEFATEAGINLIYDPKNEYDFYHNLSTGRPILQPNNLIATKFSHHDFHQVKVTVPDGKRVYVIESRGECQLLKYIGTSDSLLEYLESEIDGVAYFRFNNELCSYQFGDKNYKVVSSDADKLEKFDKEMNPTSKPRELSEHDLHYMERLFKGEAEIFRKSELTWYDGPLKKEFYYDNQFVRFYVSDEAYDIAPSIENEVDIGRFKVINVPLNCIAIVVPHSNARELKPSDDYRQGNDLIVHGRGQVLVNKNASQLVGIYPVSVRTAKFSFDVSAQQGEVLQITGSMRYNIGDASKAIIPHFMGEFNPRNFLTVLLGLLDKVVQDVVQPCFQNYIKQYSVEQTMWELGLTSQLVSVDSSGDASERKNLQEDLERIIQSKCHERGFEIDHLIFKAQPKDRELIEIAKQHARERKQIDHGLYVARKEQEFVQIRIDTAHQVNELRAEAVAGVFEATQDRQLANNAGQAVSGILANKTPQSLTIVQETHNHNPQPSQRSQPLFGMPMAIFSAASLPAAQPTGNSEGSISEVRPQ